MFPVLEIICGDEVSSVRLLSRCENSNRIVTTVLAMWYVCFGDFLEVKSISVKVLSRADLKIIRLKIYIAVTDFRLFCGVHNVVTLHT